MKLNLALILFFTDGRIKSTFPATSPNEHEIDVGMFFMFEWLMFIIVSFIIAVFIILVF